MAETEMILQHGWAFDPSIWSAVKQTAQLREDNIVCKLADRGYFGSNPENPTFSLDARMKILVVHSLGLHLTDHSNFASADHIVVISGFSQFHDGSEREAKLSKLTLRKMFQKLERMPIDLLNDFWLNCGLNAASPALPQHSEDNGECNSKVNDERNSEGRSKGKLDIGLLARDLRLLDENTIDDNLLNRPKHVTLLHGAADKIAPVRHVDYLKMRCPKARVAIIDNATHALPFTSAQWCITEFFENYVAPSR